MNHQFRLARIASFLIINMLLSGCGNDSEIVIKQNGKLVTSIKYSTEENMMDCFRQMTLKRFDERGMMTKRLWQSGKCNGDATKPSMKSLDVFEYPSANEVIISYYKMPDFGDYSFSDTTFSMEKSELTSRIQQTKLPNVDSFRYIKQHYYQGALSQTDTSFGIYSISEDK